MVALDAVNDELRKHEPRGDELMRLQIVVNEADRAPLPTRFSIEIK